MAFTAKILSWRFRHLNIVGCLLKRRPTKGGSRAPQDPPSYAHEKKRPVISPPLACIEMNLTFYDDLKLKKAIKFEKYFDQHCYIACSETLFLA